MSFKIFDDGINEENVKEALAVLMCNIIRADGKSTKQEESKAIGFFKDEFNMSEKETKDLFETMLSRSTELEEQAKVLEDAFSNDSIAKGVLIQHINNLIICDGCKDSEYYIFEKIQKSLI